MSLDAARPTIHVPRPTSSQPWRDSQAGHVYVAHFRVRFSDLDPMDHVNNAVYLNWIEQAAIDHATLAGYGYEVLKEIGGAFIARRHELEYRMPALAGDSVRVTTWPEAMSGARAFRRYEVTRMTGAEISAGVQDQLYPRDAVPPPLGDLLLSAHTEWAYVKIATGRPQRLPAGIEAAFLATVDLGHSQPPSANTRGQGR